MWNITAHVLQLGLTAKFIEPVGTLKALRLVVLAPGSSLPTTDPSAVIPGERSETRDPGTPTFRRLCSWVPALRCAPAGMTAVEGVGRDPHRHRPPHARAARL